MTDPIYGDPTDFQEYRYSGFQYQFPIFLTRLQPDVSGGNEKGNYYAGLGYNHSEGTAVGNKYQRITFTFNADYKLNHG